MAKASASEAAAAPHGPGSPPGPSADPHSGRFTLFPLCGSPPRRRLLPESIDFRVLQPGPWVCLPAQASTFELDIYDAPRPPRYPTAFELKAHDDVHGSAAFATHGFADGLGTSRHELRAAATAWRSAIGSTCSSCVASR